LNSIPNDLVPLGKFIKPHGIKGELKVFLYNSESNTLINGTTIWVKIDDKFISYKVIGLRGGLKNNKLLKINQVDTLSQALLFSKNKIYVSRNDFNEIDDKSFYFNDLIDCSVFDEKNKALGKVIDVLSFPANDVLLINYGSKEVMVPIVEDFILLFDINNRLVKLKNINIFFEL